MLTLLHPSELNFFQILFKHRGVVYGAYLRDVIAHDEPRSIDVMVPAASFSDFHHDMLEAGYRRFCGIYASRYELPVDAHVYETDTPGELPNSFEEIGYDVNLLAYDGTRLYNWDAIDEKSIPDILEAIEAHHATLLNSELPDWELRRQTRLLLERGYIIGSN